MRCGVHEVRRQLLNMEDEGVLDRGWAGCSLPFLSLSLSLSLSLPLSPPHNRNTSPTKHIVYCVGEAQSAAHNHT